MELLTNSAKNVYQECPRKFMYMIEKGYRPIKDAGALTFGTLIHKLLEAYMSGEADNIPAILLQEEEDPYRRESARELINGYMRRWPDITMVKEIEKEFKVTLVNPKTQSASRTWALAGKIDAIITDGLMEHKTTVEDIESPESNYWLKLVIDPQITGYLLGAEALGYKPKKIIYDVIHKPRIKPIKATPEENRKYKKDGSLYASQREKDETPEEYGLRLRQNILENPNRYYQRKEVVRLETDIIEYLEDMWSVSKLIMESRNKNFWPRRPSQCFNYGKCAFYPVCSKMAALEDPTLYRPATKKNEELTI